VIQTRMFYKTVSGANTSQETITFPICRLLGVSLSLAVQAAATVAGYAIAKLTLEGGTLPSLVTTSLDLPGVIAGVVGGCDFGALGNAGNANPTIYVPIPGGIELVNRPLYLVVIAGGVGSFTQVCAIMQYE